jgi:hypothetical protein
MAKSKNPKPHLVEFDESVERPVSAESAAKAAEGQPGKPAEEMTEDEREEAEFRAMRRDLPGVKGASAAGTVLIGVSKAPPKNSFFRTHPDYRPIVPLVNVEQGMDRHYFAVTPAMIEPLASINISVADHVLYLTVTSDGTVRIVPVRCADEGGNEYNFTKENCLLEAMDQWMRLSTDTANQCYKNFPAPAGRFKEPRFPDLKPHKIFKLAFRAKGRLVDSEQHPLFLKWSARDRDDDKKK